MRTSNDLNNIVGDEVQSFVEELLIQFGKLIEDKKSSEMFNAKKAFNLNINRQLIQRQTDNDIFSPNASPEIILLYLENPADIIEARY